jgi:hypothetical protein
MLRILFSRAAALPWLGLLFIAAGALFPEGNVVGIVLIVIGANVAFYSLRDFSQKFEWGAQSRSMLNLCALGFLLGLGLVAASARVDGLSRFVALLSAGLYLCLFAVWIAQQPVSLPYWILGVVGSLLMILGGIAGFLGWKEWRVFAESEANPQEISLQDLLQKGFGSNRFVRITEFRFCDRHATERERKESQIRTHWFPIVPRDNRAVKKEGPAPGVPPRVVAVVSYVSVGDVGVVPLRLGKEPMDVRLRRDKEAKGYECTVVTGIKNLKPEVRDQLLEMAPQTDLTEVVVLHFGKPASAETVYATFGGGTAGFILGLFCLCVVYFRARRVVGSEGWQSETAEQPVVDSPPTE